MILFDYGNKLKRGENSTVLRISPHIVHIHSQGRDEHLRKTAVRGLLPMGPGTQRCLTCECSPAQPEESQMAAAPPSLCKHLSPSPANKPPCAQRRLRAASVRCNPETDRRPWTWVVFIIRAPSNRVICLGSGSLMQTGLGTRVV